MVAVVEEDAARSKRFDMGVVTMLIERHQHIRPVTGREDVTRAHPHLENGRSARDGGRNRHVGHDVLVAASGEPGEEPADSLDAVLRVAGQPDNNVMNRPESTAWGGAARSFGGVWTDHEFGYAGEIGLQSQRVAGNAEG